MFTSKLNTMTGKLDWEIQSEDYDYQQELARAGFADMLHDLDRNVKYFAGLKKVIAKLKSENKKVHVLDIGTGTGLLSMMAVHCGADRVTACEAFVPMIKVAKQCIADNGMADRIEIIEKRSTEIIIGEDMDERANVLVTEVFDTELIGEGAISTFNHALENLLTKDCYVIPDNAVMYVQVIDSSVCRDWNWFNVTEKYGIKVPADFKNPAGDSILDLQLDEFDKMFKPITEPIVAFNFSFSGKEPLPFDKTAVVKANTINDGASHAVLMWWVCHMDWENEILMSCAPKWANHITEPSEIPWRDHWMQSCYFPSKFMSFKKGESLEVLCRHDEYSLWFDVDHSVVFQDSLKGSNEEERSLGYTLVSRNRLGQINETHRNDMFMRLLQKYENGDRTMLISNDDLSMVPLLAGKMNFKKIYVLESNRLRKDLLKRFIQENECEKKITIIEKSLHELEASDFDLKIDLVLSELAFSSSHLPWENMYFYYGAETLKKIGALSELSEVDTDQGRLNLIPFRVRFYAIAVQFAHLHKIRSPVVETCGFRLKDFDRVILGASKQSDGFLEPHPLWEYPSNPLSDVHEIFSYDSQTQNLENSSKFNIPMPITSNGTLNGIALWHEIDYDESDPTLSLNAGLLEKPVKNQPLVWSQNYKQAVQILDETYEVTSSDTENFKLNLNCHVSFNPVSGKFDVNFQVKNNSKSLAGQASTKSDIPIEGLTKQIIV